MRSLYGEEAPKEFYEVRPSYIERGDLIRLEVNEEPLIGKVDSKTYFPQSGEYMIAVKDEDPYVWLEDDSRIAENKIESVYIAEKSLDGDRWRKICQKAEGIAEALEGRLDEL